MMDAAAWLTTPSPYLGYAYSYPHKSAYRRLSPAIGLANAWAEERRDGLFLYVHVPFCEYRCGFCNLFTLAGAEDGWTTAYLRQIQTEANAVKSALGDANFVRVAIGGGTPTYLNDGELAQLLEIAGGMLGKAASGVPASCEASPATLTAAKARRLKAWGVSRISLGVQTFDDAQLHGLGRPQRRADVERAIELARQHDFPVLNLDLIYGSAEQSLASWMATVETAVSHRPEELFLYPLYIRELTGLGRLACTASDDRLLHYREARELLLAQGYEQTSLRMFRLPTSGHCEAPVYCCQTDGMVGLGCGARSYTSTLHYSTEFAVGRSGVRSILRSYLDRTTADFLTAQHGYALNAEEQRRRYVIQSLLQVTGLDRGLYQQRFQSDPLVDLPQLAELMNLGLANIANDCLQLTAAGLERSDAIGPWLYSPRVRSQMEEFECV